MAPLGLQQQQQQQQQGAPLRGRRGGSFPLARAPAAHAAVAGRRLLTVSAAIKAKSRREICCSKTLVAQPDMIDKVHKMCADVTAFSEARMGDPTSGVKAFECAKDRWEENVFHFWERYESNVALGRHNTTPEVSQFLEQVVPLLEGPVGMALYEWKDGQLGPVSLQGGPKGEGGLDDATGASGAAGGASMKQTSRSFDLSAIEAQHKAESGDVFGMPELTRKVEEQFGQLMSGLGKLFGSKK